MPFFGDKRLLKVMNFCFQPYLLEIFFPWSLHWSPLIALNLPMDTELNGIDWSCFSKEVESKIENLPKEPNLSLRSTRFNNILTTISSFEELLYKDKTLTIPHQVFNH